MEWNGMETSNRGRFIIIEYIIRSKSASNIGRAPPEAGGGGIKIVDSLILLLWSVRACVTLIFEVYVCVWSRCTSACGRSGSYD